MMKKTALISIFTLLLSFIIIGCGSNTKRDPIAPTVPGEGAYELTNVTSPFNIGYAGQQSTFQVQLVQGNIPVSGEIVSAVSLPASFGFIDTTSVTTNDGGYAVFNYTAADPLTNGTYPLELIFDDKNGSIAKTYLNINVEEGTIPFNYQFVATTTPINVTEVSQALSINTYVMDQDNKPQEGKLVSASPLSTQFGTITPLSQLSDKSGLVSFTYQAPSDLTGLSSASTTLSLTEGANSISQKVDIIFKGSGYSLTSITTPIVINQGGQKAEISGYLVDENGVGVAGQSVNITPPPSNYGTVTPSTAATDGAGKAIFAYEAPLHLTGLSGTTLTMSYFDGTQTVSANVDIQISGGGAVGYQLTNAKNPYYINAANQTDLFDIQLTKNNFPVLGVKPCTTSENTLSKECVAITSLDRRFGGFIGTTPDPDLGQVAIDGYVYFKYVAPSDSDKAANGEDTKFIVEYIDDNGQVVATSEPILLRMRY
jgi:hypothetical protein